VDLCGFLPFQFIDHRGNEGSQSLVAAEQKAKPGGLARLYFCITLWGLTWF
jgi:hypothetical protein